MVHEQHDEQWGVNLLKNAEPLKVGRKELSPGEAQGLGKRNHLLCHEGEQVCCRAREVMLRDFTLLNFDILLYDRHRLIKANKGPMCSQQSMQGTFLTI